MYEAPHYADFLSLSSVHLGLNIFLSALFSVTLSFCSSVDVGN
jgi:hypothetical protein